MAVELWHRRSLRFFLLLVVASTLSQAAGITPEWLEALSWQAREALAADNRRADAFAKAHDIPGAVGSDAHRPWELGGAYLEVDDFAGRDDFIAAGRGGRVQGRLAGHSIHVWTRYDKPSKGLAGRRTTGPRRGRAAPPTPWPSGRPARPSRAPS